MIPQIGDAWTPATRARLFSGDLIQWDGEIDHDRLGHWHALMVYPQREIAARAWLQRRHVYSFFPIKKERKHLRGMWIERESRYLPGYLFARFPAEPVWHLTLDSPFIYNAIRSSNGEPGRLHPDSIRSLRAMASTDDQIAHQAKIARTPKPGDMVKLKGGIYDGWEVEVSEIVAGKARFQIKLLGQRMLDYPMDRVEKIA